MKHLPLLLLIIFIGFSCAPPQESTVDKPVVEVNLPVNEPDAEPVEEQVIEPDQAVQEGPWQAMEEVSPGLVLYVKEVFSNMKDHEFLKVHDACYSKHFDAQVNEAGQDGESYLIEMFNLDESLAEVPAGPLYLRLEQITAYTVSDFYEVEGDGFDYTIDGYFETAEGDAEFTVNILIEGGNYYLIGAYG